MACKHPDGWTRVFTKSCGCKHLKCMFCSMEARTRGCRNHGTKQRILNPGRK